MWIANKISTELFNVREDLLVITIIIFCNSKLRNSLLLTIYIERDVRAFVVTKSKKSDGVSVSVHRK